MTRRQFLALMVPLLLVLLGYFTLGIVERSGWGGSPPWDDSFARDLRNSMAREFAYGLGDRDRQVEAYFRALNGWLSAFDEYGEVVPPNELQAARERSSGQYFGIGVRTTREARPPEGIEGVRITGVKPKGPADKAGVKVGDTIIAVDGLSIRSLTAVDAPRSVEETIRGERGASVILRLRAPNGDERDANVVRDAIDSGSVFGGRIVDAEQGIGYLRISGFHLDTEQSTVRELKRLLGLGMKSLVLDLRDNPGGLLEQAVGVADLFLEEGIIVRVVGRGPAYPKVHRAKKEGTIGADFPLVLLLSRKSASASEVLAGALQDHRRALIVGERSYGKFLVQTVEELPMEYGTVLFKRTTAIYETPAGHHYQRRLSTSFAAREGDPLAGIAPDLTVPLSALDREKLAIIFENEEYVEWNPAQEPVLTDFVDPPLAAAVELLAGRPYTASIGAR